MACPVISDSHAAPVPTSAGTCAARFTLRPTPTTTRVVAPVERLSDKMPAHLLPSINKSFGHFNASVTEHTLATASATASAAQKPTAGSASALNSTGKMVE